MQLMKDYLHIKRCSNGETNITEQEAKKKRIKT